ncbi:MAG: virulence RhuM family protein [Desulfuromonadaceae bacterium]|nr:virulence RhuM family protein [Desulfuromonadaceae bacterium]MDD2854077.1 virulence RhuM family protein [Desulfuromonadaceae bacterium]
MASKKSPVPVTGEFLLYTSPDGKIRIETRIQNETVWLSLNQMAELFQVDKSGISRHLKNIFETGELQPDATVANFATVQQEGARTVSRTIDHFNLDVIISVGYRVNSIRGTQFRIWATQRLREYIIKGFTMDDERLKQAGSGNYFEELLARIRDIRSSEKVFWRKVLDIYATSIDYSPSAEASRQFFATIQNKMHWASHGKTAAEIIHHRADAGKPNMGMTNWHRDTPRKADSEIAKNYLNEQELEILNRIVTAYLEFAELQALSRKPMYMTDWIAKLDDFLKLSGREILKHGGIISHEEAMVKAHVEYERYRAEQLLDPTHVELDFLAVVKELEERYLP